MAKKIRLHSGESSLVSDCDYPLLSNFSWCLRDKYASGTIAKASVQMHRLIMGAKFGEIVDHINGNPLDNRRENLRIVNAATNNQSRRSVKKFPFIGLDKSDTGFRVRIRVKGFLKSIGIYSDPIDAARAYDKAALKYFGKNAMTNKKFLEDLLAKLKSKK